MRGLALFRRNSAGALTIASWHSPHSMTWRWMLCAGRQRVRAGRPQAMFSRVGPHITLGAGIGSLISGYAMRHNGGWQFGITVVGLALSFSQQRPM